MRCKQARRELALWVGGDHDPRLYPLLESHLEGCPECRAFAREMKNSLDPLHAVASGSPAATRSESGSSGSGWSLWPAVQARLSRRRVQFSDLLDTPVGWVPVTGLTVACLTLFVVVFNTSHISQRPQLTGGFDAPMLHQTSVNYPFDHSRLLDHSQQTGPIGPQEYISPDFAPVLVPQHGSYLQPARFGIFETDEEEPITLPYEAR